jgi:hypothetical protein
VIAGLGSGLAHLNEKVCGELFNAAATFPVGHKALALEGLAGGVEAESVAAGE